MSQERELLKKIFGYDNFRPMQGEAISSILAKRDTLIVMPTGGGKSVCYQIPALIFDGLTIVVSPLISLMKDQVDQMKQLGIEAILLNSSISRDEYNKNINLIRERKAKILYLAPETLLKNEILAMLSDAKVECIAIDEAHCISEWGHDFRPEYRKIAVVRKRFPEAVCIALTATATERVRADIRKSLELKESDEYVASFNRENLFYRIVPKDNPLKQILEILEEFKGESGIIYCFSRDKVDRLYAEIKNYGYSVKPYHAGLTDEEREKNQELFLKDEVQIMVATIAFGMGIHKTNVRFVIHNDLPKSVEAYYQETGRAGRDGVDSTCILLYSYGDIQKIRYFINQKESEREKKSAELQLSALVDYAESNECRRIPLLNYFGESHSGGCSMCDNCTTERQEEVDITLQAQMFLSCVKRTDERFGAAHIVNILCGSRSQKIIDLKHHELSTYGIGKDLSRDVWKNLARQFIRKGLLFQDIESYNTLKLTEKAYSVMKGREKVSGIIQEENKRSSARDGSYDAELFEILRSRRREIAERESVPPYIIFSDKTLIDIATRYPQSIESLSAIYGIGSSKIDRYGESVISIVRSYCSENGISERKIIPAMDASFKKERFVETGEAFCSGATIAEIAERDEIKERTVVDHLYKYLSSGFGIDPNLLLPLVKEEENLDQIMDAFEKHSHERLKPVFDDLNESVDYDTLQICRLYYMSR